MPVLRENFAETAIARTVIFDIPLCRNIIRNFLLFNLLILGFSYEVINGCHIVFIVLHNLDFFLCFSRLKFAQFSLRMEPVIDFPNFIPILLLSGPIDPRPRFQAIFYQMNKFTVRSFR